MNTQRTAKQLVRAAADNYSIELITDVQIDKWAVKYLRDGTLVDDDKTPLDLVRHYDPDDSGDLREALRDPAQCRNAKKLSDDDVQALYEKYCDEVSNRVRKLVKARARKLWRWHRLMAEKRTTTDERRLRMIDVELQHVECPHEESQET